MVERTLFIGLIWLIDRFTDLPTRLRCTLWSLIFIKSWVPPLFSIPIEQVAETARPAMAMAVKHTVSYTSAAMGGSIFPTPALALLALWLLSIALIFSIILIHNILLSRCLEATTPQRVHPENLPVGIPNGIEIYTIHTIRSPVLIGLWNPRIYLPSNWLSWSSAQLHAVLSHEIAHYTHRDLWGILFQTITVATYGLNPLIWLVHHRLSHLRERRCDEVVIHKTGIRPLIYAHLLYACLEGPSDRFQSMALGSPLFRSVRSISSRIKHILNLPASQTLASRWQCIPVVIAVLLIGPLSVQGIDQNKGRSMGRSLPPAFMPIADSSGVGIGLRWHDDAQMGTLELIFPDGSQERMLISDPLEIEGIFKIVHRKLAEHEITLTEGRLYRKVAQAQKQMIAGYKFKAEKHKIRVIEDLVKKRIIEKGRKE